MCDPEGCSTIWGAVGGGGGPHPPPKGGGWGPHPPSSLTQTQQSGEQNQKWPTSGQGGYITRAASGVPTASERGTESEVAPKWARWLHNPCRLGGPHRFKAGNLNKKKSRPITTALANAQTSSHQPRSDPEAGSGSKSFFVLFSHF